MSVRPSPDDGHTCADRGHLRVLVCGLGLIGSARARAVNELAQQLPVTLAATVDPSAEPLDDVKAPHYRDIEQVPPGTFDAAVVSVPHDVAPQLARRALESACPILVEKPLAVNGAEARELAQLATTARAQCFVGYNYRFLPAVAELMRRCAAGELGRLRNVDMLLGHGGNPRSAEGWKLNPERAGGGVLLDPGVHLLDLLMRLDPELCCTHVEATRGFWGTGIEEDVVTVFAHDGLIATMRVSHIRWVNTFRIEVIGENGYGIVEGRGGNYGPQTLRLGERWAWDRGQGSSQRETEQVSDFGTVDRSIEAELDAVLRCWLGEQSGEGPRPATIAEALVITELCESIYSTIAEASAVN